MMKHLLLVTTLLLSFFLQVAGEEVRCLLKGEVIGRKSKTLVLLKDDEDPRFHGIKIPIRNGRFEYELIIPEMRRYELAFQEELNRGSWRPIPFFPCKGTVEFILHAEGEESKNMVRGGELNDKMKAFEQERERLFSTQLDPIYQVFDELHKANNYYSPQGQALYDQLRKSKNRGEMNQLYKEIEKLRESKELYTEIAKQSIHRQDSILQLMRTWEWAYFKEEQSLFSYAIIFRNLFFDHDQKISINYLNEVIPLFAQKFPDHSYTQLVGNLYQSRKSIRIGGKYIDFSAPTLEGEVKILSEEIRGKVAVIDLWASWCGSCIQRSKELIPIYEKYKDRGFTVVGVACEYKNTKEFERALARDQYPWLNLIELDNANKIWEKYGVIGGGGNTFLVDTQGNIIAIQPSTEEIEQLLEKEPNTKNR